MQAHTHTRTPVCTHVLTHAHTQLHIYADTHIHTYMHTHINTCTYTQVFVIHAISNYVIIGNAEFKSHWIYCSNLHINIVEKGMSLQFP